MRDNIILVGTNHARASISVRERLSLSPEALSTALTGRPSELSEFVILSTCNRSEFYALGRGAGILKSSISDLTGVSVHDLSDATYSLSGHEAVSHLFKVASGLNSMVLGEPHVLGQVRKAFELAMEVNAAGPVLSRLGQDAVHVGKLVRTHTELARNRLSIPHAAIDLASRFIPAWSNCRAAVAGAGEMGTLAAKLLNSCGLRELVIVNRDEARGRALASSVGARFSPLSDLLTEVERADLVVSAVAVETFLLRSEDIESRARPLVVIDLGVPRTVDPDVRNNHSVRLFDIDDLEQLSAYRRESSAADVERAELLIEEARDAFLRWWAARESAPAIAELSGMAEAIRETELNRALRKLGHLSDRDRNVVATLSVGIVNKLLHKPIMNLRGSLDGGESAALRRLFGFQTGFAHDAQLESGRRQDKVAAWDKPE